jgi:predicted nucleic acid-binding protein
VLRRPWTARDAWAFVDAHTAILMREHGRTIYTRDTDFHRFPFLDVIDPLARSV